MPRFVMEKTIDTSITFAISIYDKITREVLYCIENIGTELTIIKLERMANMNRD